MALCRSYWRYTRLASFTQFIIQFINYYPIYKFPNLSGFVAFSWFLNVFDHIPLIVGKRAEQEHLSRILRIAMNHDNRIRCLDHVLVYHIGEKALVELHVVLDEGLPLKLTHDVCIFHYLQLPKSKLKANKIFSQNLPVL